MEITTKLNLPDYSFRIKTEEDKTYIFDEIRKKFILLTPEEWVRQNFIKYLIQDKGFPSSLMAIENGLKINKNIFRTDLLVYNRKKEPILIVEFKAPNIKITQKTFDQIARYNMKFRTDCLIVSNGMQHYCCLINRKEETYFFLKNIPDYKNIKNQVSDSGINNL
ncbi:MAG: type I restriction enzyme HsdR N-terminal domain-containing protein [Prolixibacteraceae bacterium]|nr:type I restriction enzyme HsdR N-terminal domain-containing protein [Prolixibacteraceae bacterium]